ncbi:hypothetical protein [Neobacillus drentensis]|uniref:hypothetical protein n=1 Tax=Neobacillus drentensis TaxID=220684 RepID=UPI002FFF0697
MKWDTYKKTILGISLLSFLFILSLLYPLYGPKDLNKVVLFIYDKKGEFAGVPPMPPSSYFPLGSDRNGQDILMLILYGAKFTIISAFSVAFLRVFIGGMLGIIFSLWLKRILPIVTDFLLVFKIVPPIIMTLFLMRRVSFFIEDAIYNILLYQIIILVIIGIPSVLLTTSGILEELKGKSFTLSSYLMGGSHYHVLKTQFTPYIKSYGVLMFVQQLLSSLVLIMYLGVFQIYIGGVSKTEVHGLEILNSNSKEWAGLVGQNIYEFLRTPHIVLVPLICYFIIIIIINIIKKELEASMEIIPFGISLTKKKAKRKHTAKDHKKDAITASDFILQRDVTS